MKKIIKYSTYVLMSGAMIFGLGGLGHRADAAFVYTAYEIPYIVTSSLQPPIANAGADRELPPSGSVSIPTFAASGFDADGTIVAYSWAQTGGSGASISGGSSLVPTFANAEVGDIFTLTVTDNDGLTGSDSMEIIPPNVDPNPEIFGQCSSPLVKDSCAVGGGTASGGHQNGANWEWSCVGVNSSGQPANTVSCSVPNTPPVAVCNNSVRDGCSVGQYQNDDHVDGVYFKWSCKVASPLSVAQCQQFAGGGNNNGNGGGSTECNDTLDNETPTGDGLIDQLDPSCHTDCDATNVSSYDPNLNNEAKKCTKIKYIEI